MTGNHEGKDSLDEMKGERVVICKCGCLIFLDRIGYYDEYVKCPYCGSQNRASDNDIRTME